MADRPNILFIMTDQQRGEQAPWRPYLHIEHPPYHHALTDGKEKFIWLPKDGREQFFDLTEDPTECRNLIDDPSCAQRAATWRAHLIEELKDRPEGFVDGKGLVPGRPCSPVLKRT